MITNFLASYEVRAVFHANNAILLVDIVLYFLSFSTPEKSGVHNNEVIMVEIASQITSLTIV